MLIICAATVVAAAFIYGVWRWLGWYIAPESPTDRKDHVQVMAVGMGAVGAIITAIIGWRNLKQSQRSTEKTLKNTRVIEEERAQNDALQKYLEQMGQLLTKENLRSSEEGSDVRVLARSQTLTVLQGLGPNHKQILLRFLNESQLINNEAPIVSLVGANLIGANLRGADLSEADLSEAKLIGANLSNADLSGADSIGADLSGAFFSEADLSTADLFTADLSGATLDGADLSKANLSGAEDLTQAHLEHTTGDNDTLLPEGIDRPKTWSARANEPTEKG